MSLIYMASPYSNYAHGRFWAYDQACRAAARMVEADLPVFAPVVYGHTVAKRMQEMPHEFWLNFCLSYMIVSGRCAILTLEGWQDSMGIMCERQWFISRNRPVSYISVADLQLDDAHIRRVVYGAELKSSCA